MPIPLFLHTFPTRDRCHFCRLSPQSAPSLGVMPRGRTSSSSPDHHRRRGHRDRRTSRRSRAPRESLRDYLWRVHFLPLASTFENCYSTPKSWIYLDRNQECKLTFPRRVIATAWSRNLHIDHQAIEDVVRLIDVLSRKQENWTLRLVANGRLVQFQGFRNRQLTSGLPCLAKSSRALMWTSPVSLVTYILPLSRTIGMRSARAWTTC